MHRGSPFFLLKIFEKWFLDFQYKKTNLQQEKRTIYLVMRKMRAIIMVNSDISWCTKCE